MFARVAIVAATLVVASSSTGAEEILTTAGAAQPLPQVEPAAAAPAQVAATTPAEDRRAQEIGAWARGVLAGQPSTEDAPAAAEARRCPPSDGRPHGQVWGEVGSRGYRSVGGVVTQPVGECGSVTVGVSKSEGGYGRSHYRRR